MSDAVLKQIGMLVEHYGLTGAIIVIVLVLLITLMKTKFFSDLTVKFMKKITTKLFKKRKKVVDSSTIIQVSDSDIINHEIFSHIDFWVYSEIPTMEFSSEYRTVVFRKYLHIYYKSYKDTSISSSSL